MVSYKVGDMTTNEVEKRTSIKFHPIYGEKNRAKSVTARQNEKNITMTRAEQSRYATTDM